MNNRLVVNGLRILWLVVIIWYELGVFLSSAQRCRWPDFSFPTNSYSQQHTATHILLVADPQILDHRSYPERGRYLTYLTRLVVDLNLRKNWWAALRKRPDVVIFLGDMMDGGRFDMADDEYEGYYRRFKNIFRLPLGIPTYFIPGNHDVGLRSSPTFSPKARERYSSHFGPLNNYLTIANHLLVLLDAPSLVEEDDERVSLAKTLKDWTPRPGGSLEQLKYMAEGHAKQRILLFSHIPLSRRTFNCGPLREKGTIRPGIGPGYQNTLGTEVTSFVLEELRPAIVFSGDDHDYCENNHTFSSNGTESTTKEISIKSLSMAMGIKRPGFQLLSLAPDAVTPGDETHANLPCVLPDQIAIYLSTYLPLLLLSLFVIFTFNALRVRNRASPRHHGTRSLPQPDLIACIRQTDNSSEDEYSNDALLPEPASSSLHKRGARPYPRTSFCRWRRFRCSDVVRQLCTCHPISNRVTRQQKYQGFLPGFIQDTKDVAIFPLTVFLVISIWMSF